FQSVMTSAHAAPAALANASAVRTSVWKVERFTRERRIRAPSLFRYWARHCAPVFLRGQWQACDMRRKSSIVRDGVDRRAAIRIRGRGYGRLPRAGIIPRGPSLQGDNTRWQTFP